MTPRSRMRRHARLPFADPMQLSWKDARGQVQNLRAKCLDLSAEGARLETDTPIPARAGVSRAIQAISAASTTTTSASIVKIAGQYGKRP